MSSLTGKLIVIEGLEGAGKSTAVNLVVELLSQKKISTITTREPGGTIIGEILRSIIKNPEYNNVLDDRSELLLLYAARIQLIEQVIKPALSQGQWVIADRFELSTLAYQGGGRKMDMRIINELSNFCLKGFKPDLTLYLDINPELGMERAKSRGKFDRIEQESIEFFHRIHNTYHILVKKNPEIIMIDANRPLEEVQYSIQSVIEEFIEHSI
ncbi:dTMP kinase [Legionella pneumophila]|uniref:Thymidylate kinase n=1 Tax=Legionella pneumophila subsp. pascullei TaxID=91890 RepID=A0AAX2IYB7_LEGPN|nr:dTMP kinase [Legionella pneumophila]AMP89952.1 dTMP kinase [Legionella pneumophila subsp. pascullei]AMP92381.1 thymidylate kinase [Legionella pneumophila subsp. pascullei]AMP95347.1 thymidylate kinase [Legionella pneumophila subsp. pascullei]SQG90243.1 dTMP kinase [Legionella pneumophila subsp. pascullei]VEH06321.1 dTMP kinase [Legionella pneumophila subsp. pascullei]